MQKKFKFVVGIAVIFLFVGCATTNYQKGIDTKNDNSQLSFITIKQDEPGLSLHVAKIDSIAYGDFFFGYPSGPYYLTAGQHMVEFVVYKTEGGFTTQRENYSGSITIRYTFEPGKKYQIIAKTYRSNAGLSINSSIVELE